MFTIIFLIGTVIANIATIQELVSGDVETLDKVKTGGKALLATPARLDNMGLEAIEDYQTRGSNIAVGYGILVFLAFAFMFNMLYKVFKVVINFIKGNLSRTRESVIAIAITIVVLGVLTAGFPFTTGWSSLDPTNWYPFLAKLSEVMDLVDLTALGGILYVK